MTKQYYLFGAIAVVIIGAGLLMFRSAYHGDASKDTPIHASGSMTDIIAKGGSWKCEVSHKNASDDTAGVVYIADGKMRGDFESTIPQTGKIETHMISDASYAYTWTSLMKTGMKIKVTPQAATSSASVEKQDMYHQQYDYQCSSWKPDATFFNLPTDIAFNEMGMIPTASATGTAPTTLPDCSVCNAAPAGAARNQCKAALHCK